MADGMMLLQRAIKMIQQAALGLPPGSPLHRDALKAATSLSRHMGGAAGAGPAVGVEKTQSGDEMRRIVQNMLLQRIIGQKGAGGQMPQQAPMPSTPLPGA